MNNFIKSENAYKEAVNYMPGGVNSPVRAFQSVGMSPIFIAEGNGANVIDIDGNEYIDYVLSWGPLILGHANEKVVEALKQTVETGTSFGAPTLLETAVAKLVQERIPSIEMIRMVNSGTEATMSALRLARGYTGRNKIVKFSGNYHGHSDALLIKAGSGVATLGLPDSPGVPLSVANETITVHYNDQEAVKEVFASYGEEIAAVIVEPVSGNMGVVPPLNDWLSFLRDITEQYKSLLIFDEVMTGFRVHYGSAQTLYNVKPDITCLGKIIGGGLPVGAYGSKREIIEQIAPSGDIYQAGTLSGNPLAMTAGLTTLQQLTEATYTLLNEKVDKLILGYETAATKYKIPIQINRVGSMFTIFFTDEPVTNFISAQKSNVERFANYYRGMIEEGIFLPPSQFESIFISTAHTDEHIAKTIQAIEKVFSTLT